MTFNKVMEKKNGLMEPSTKARIKMEKSKAKEFSPGKILPNTKVIFKITAFRGKVSTIGLTKDNMKEIGI